MDTSACKKPKMELQHEADVTIHQLNYDCLRYVLSYLNVRELLVAEEVCKMFKAVAEDIYKTRRVLHSKFLINCTLPYYIDRAIQEAEAEKIFQRVGPYVETLILNRPHFNTSASDLPILEFVWKFCSKLRSISLTSFTFDNNICTNLSTVFNNVDEVYLYSKFVTDANLQIMFNLCQIKKLILKNTRVGDFLTHLQDILKITIVDGILEPNKLQNFIEANTQLTHLNITSNRKMTQDCLSAIANNLKNLEALEIYCDYKDVPQECYLPLMELPKLKKISINKSEFTRKDVDIIGVLIEKIARYNRLENLKIFFGATIITSQLAQALVHLTKIKKLTLSKTPICIDYFFGHFKCENTLEKLDVSSTEISATDLANIIIKCKNLRFINVRGNGLTYEFIPMIKDVLNTRNQKLVIDLGFLFACPHIVEPYERNKLELIFEIFHLTYFQ